MLLTPFMLALVASAPAAELWVTLPGGSGPGAGKHIVLVSGDEEYRSEEALPQLAKILSAKHGFACTVLFAIDPADNTVNPNRTDNIPGLEQLASADLMVLFTRMRKLPDAQLKHFANYIAAGKPIVALRTATHPFSGLKGEFEKYNYGSKVPGWEGGFGRVVLGETWVAHHGAHKKEGCRGLVEKGQDGHPILRGIASGDVFATSDVYTANPPKDSTILLRGEVTATLEADSKGVPGKKNDPMQPIAWTRSYNKGRIVTTTTGAAHDLQWEGTRRLIINACYWAAGLDDKIPAKSDASLVGEFKPSMFAFKKNEEWKPGKTPADYFK
jgi:type 1 glutamine amidotransferase